MMRKQSMSGSPLTSWCGEQSMKSIPSTFFFFFFFFFIIILSLFFFLQFLHQQGRRTRGEGNGFQSTTPHVALLYALCPWASLTPSTCCLQASHFDNPIHSCWWLTDPEQSGKSIDHCGPRISASSSSSSSYSSFCSCKSLNRRGDSRIMGIHPSLDSCALLLQLIAMAVDQPTDLRHGDVWSQCASTKNTKTMRSWQWSITRTGLFIRWKKNIIGNFPPSAPVFDVEQSVTMYDCIDQTLSLAPVCFGHGEWSSWVMAQEKIET